MQRVEERINIANKIYIKNIKKQINTMNFFVCPVFEKSISPKTGQTKKFYSTKFDRLRQVQCAILLL